MASNEEYPERRRWDGDHSTLAYEFDEELEPVDTARLIYEYNHAITDEPITCEVVVEFEEFMSHNSWLQLTERSPLGNAWFVKPNGEVFLDPYHTDRQHRTVGRAIRVVAHEPGAVLEGDEL